VPSGNEQITTHLFAIGPNAPDLLGSVSQREENNTGTYTGRSIPQASPRYIAGVLPAAPGLVVGLARSVK